MFLSLEFKIQDSGFKDRILGNRMYSKKFRVQGLGFAVEDSRVKGLRV